MTGKEARHYLSVPSSTNGSGRCTDEQHYEAKQIAIKALEQEPCDDVVSRQAVLDLMRSLKRWYVRSEDGKFNNVGLLYDDVMFGIDKLPSVRPQEQTGMSDAVLEHYRKLAEHYDKRNV